MAENPANGLNCCYLELPAGRVDDLGAIRHWDHLKLATEGGTIWVKDLTEKDMNSVEVLSIPFKQLYYGKEHLLFAPGSLVPARKIPSLLWTPISRALPLEHPSLNHNFFGITEKIPMQLIPTSKEQEPCALLTTLTQLGRYAETAPAVRFQDLSWTLVGKEQVLIIGRPLLPLPGIAFWECGPILVPTGYEPQLAILMEPLGRRLDPSGNSRLVWLKDNTWFSVPPERLRTLSISSVRLSSRRPGSPAPAIR